MSKQLEALHDLEEIIYMSGYVLLREYCIDIAEQIKEQGYRKQEDVAREIFEELSTEIMPLVESHNKLVEKTGYIGWGYKADGMEIALLALKGILKKYGVTE